MRQLPYYSETTSLKEEHPQRVASPRPDISVLCSRSADSRVLMEEMKCCLCLSSSCNTTTPVSCVRVPSDRSPRLFIAFLFWSRQYDRQMQSGCNERRCYSEDGLLSPLNSSDRDIRRHYLCVRGKASNTCSLDKGQLFRRRQWCRAGGALL